MFARIVDCQAKAGHTDEVNAMLRNEVLPVLKEQSGFVDLIVLSDKLFAERMVCISLWHSREDAHRYHQHTYDVIMEMLQPQLETRPTLETFVVNTSTAHQIAVSRVA